MKFKAIIERRSAMWQECQNWVSKFGPVLLLEFVACSVTFAQDVRTNYMPGTDFSKYHSYAWVSEVQGIPAAGGQPDQILDAQVKQAIDAQMAAKGFTKAEDGKADLLLSYQLAIDKEKQINGFANGWGGWGSWGPWGGGLDTFSAITKSGFAFMRQRMLTRELDAASAAFDREYRRSFGQLQMRDSWGTHQRVCS